MRASYLLKKTILFFFSLAIFSSLFSQQTEFNYGNRWRFGINMGGLWQASDLQKNYAGFGGGFTIEKGLTSNKKAPLYFDLRYRFLIGNTYGLDGRVNHNISKNNAVNGITDSVSNYVSSPGYYFNNYQTKITQHDLELKVGFNQLLQKRHIHLYLWGGIGLTNAVTKVDALDATGSKYSFAGIDTTGGYATLPSLNNVFDGKSETLGNGMPGSGGKLFVAPSLGVGFGYKFSDVFSIIFEHKITFPRTDILDGEQFFQKKNTWSATNDYYHYSGASLLFTFKGSSRSTTYTDPNQYVSNTNPPQVVIISPSANPYTAPSNNVQLYANVKNVSSASGVDVRLNGAPLTAFNFTPASGSLSFDVPLQSGSNVVTITGTNTYGSASQSVTINYNQAPAGNRPPVVTISSPLNNSTMTSNTVNVNGYVKNVSQNNQVSVSVNGSIINNFSFNSSNGDVNFNASLNPGSNTIIIAGTNEFGSDSKSITVYLNSNINMLPKPNVIITNPPNNGFISSSQTFTFTAVVTEITSASQLSVQLNGNKSNDFNFNAATGGFTLPVLLAEGSNSLTITATNNSGSDTKNTSVIYKVSLPQGNPPAITFINPPTTPYSATTPVMNIQAFADNVSSKSNVQLIVNGVPDNNFSFNAQTRILDYTFSMTGPVNTITIKGTNAYGSDTKSVTINYRAEQKPVVSFISPATNPYATTNSFVSVTAQILNVSEKNQINVFMNSAAVPFTWNVLTHEIQFSTGTDKAANSVIVTGTNSAGSDSKTLIINVNATPKGKKPAVVITTPVAPGTTVTASSYQFISTIVGVQSGNDVTVQLNGVNVNAQYNNGVVTYTGTLAEGNNNFSVAATNAAGSAQASTTIVYQPPVIVKPLVIITNPAAPGTTVSSSNYQFSATVTGVQSGNDITVQLNGANVNAFFNNGIITYNGALVEGNNNFSVSATNNGGSSQATTNVIYKSVVVLKPSVIITTPSSPGTTVANSAFQFAASITGISNAKSISVQFNGVKVSAQYSNGVLTYNAALIPGNNSFSVSASNNSGTSQESTSVIYQPVQQVAPPVVIITNPVASGSTVSSSSYQFVASVSGVASASDIRTQFNGANVNAQYNNGVITFQTNLIQGNNSFSVSATNPGGTAQAGTSIIYQQPAPQVLPPVINITNPASSGTTVNVAAFVFTASISNVNSSAGLTVKFNSSAVNSFSFSPASGSFTFVSSLQSGNNTLEITASNSAGSDFKSVSVIYNADTGPGGDPNKGDGGSHGTGNNGQGGHGGNTNNTDSGTNTGGGDPNKGSGTNTGGNQNNGQSGHGGNNTGNTTGGNTNTNPKGNGVINTVIEKNNLPVKENNKNTPNQNPVPVNPGKEIKTSDPKKNPEVKTETTPEVKPK